MSNFLWGRYFALKQVREQWLLTLVTAIGVLIAAALLAAVPIYSNTMSDLGLRFRIEKDLEKPIDRVSYTTVEGLSLGGRSDMRYRDALEAVTSGRFSYLSDETFIEIRSDRLVASLINTTNTFPENKKLFQLAEESVNQNSWNTFFVWPSGFENHVKIVEGRFPVDEGKDLEVVLPDGFQAHVQLNDKILITLPQHDDCQNLEKSQDAQVAQDEKTCEPTLNLSGHFVASIVGFIKPKDPNDLRWQFAQLRESSANWNVPNSLIDPRSSVDSARDADYGVTRVTEDFGGMPLLTNQYQLENILAFDAPDLTVRQRVGIIPNVKAIGILDVSRIIDDFSIWTNDINKRLGLVAVTTNKLDSALEKYRNTQSFSKIPLFLILLQVVGIVFFYLVVVSKLFQDRQFNETQLYVTRGANNFQIVGFGFVSASLLILPAIFLGPFVADQAIAFLGITPQFDVINNGNFLPTIIRFDSFLFATGGAILGLIALLIPTVLLTTNNVLRSRIDRIRPSQKNVLQKYYLDMLFVLLAILLIWQLNQRQTIFDPDSVGGWSTDPVLLFTPFVITLAVASLLLRFYPPFLNILIKPLMLFKGVIIPIGLNRTIREPGVYARLMLLLVMAIAVGTFAASYGPTVEKSYIDRILYDNGVQFRATVTDPSYWEKTNILNEIQSIDGVADVAFIHRGDLLTPWGADVPFMAIDVDHVKKSMQFRDDFSNEEFSMNYLLGLLESEVTPGGGIDLPLDTKDIHISVFTEGLSENGVRQYIRAVYQDSEGNFEVAGLSSPRGGIGWKEITGSVPTNLVPPLKLLSLRIADQRTPELRTSGSLYFDDIVAVDKNNNKSTVENFEGSRNWIMYGARTQEEKFSITSDRYRSYNFAARWDWNHAIVPSERVIAPVDPMVPLAAIMNDKALGLFRASVNTVTETNIDDVLLPLNVRAEANMFPTMDPEKGFVIINYDHLRSAGAALGDLEIIEQNEIWIDFEPNISISDQKSIINLLEQDDSLISLEYASEPYLLSVRLDEARSDPSLHASGSGILSVAFSAVLLLAFLAFAVTILVSTYSRMVEFASLRAIGFSSIQILKSMLIEWSVIFAMGISAGILLGRQIANIMMSFLSVTETGNPVLPPYIVETDWITLITGIVMLCIFSFISLILIWTSVAQKPIVEALREGDS
tara:strand:- start:3754 stop:7263 length:3510 start_codon:yes stop_codon:yes gene_type:complete